MSSAEITLEDFGVLVCVVVCLCCGPVGSCEFTQMMTYSLRS